MPTFSNVHNLMARHGLLPGASRGILGTGRFEHDAPNRLWQMDFKSHFSFGGGRSHPLTLLDDHSRFSLCLTHCTDERREYWIRGEDLAFGDRLSLAQLYRQTV